jgi:hypothetical protein
MKLSILYLFSTSLLVHTAVAGECRVGIEGKIVNVPGGNPGTGSGANTRIDNAYVYFIDSNGDQTNKGAKVDGESFEANGSGETNGHSYSGKATIKGSADIEDCKVVLDGKTITASSAGDGVCDIYSNAGPFEKKSGCNCKFEC